MTLTTPIIEGVEYVALQSYADARGELIILEEPDGLPFFPKRIFYIKPDVTGTRACHSGNSEELITAVNGSFTVDLDNGKQQTTIHMTNNIDAIWLRPGIWLRLRNFSHDAIILVAASLTYAETIHFDQPRFPYKKD